jgi:hypothetical protein
MRNSNHVIAKVRILGSPFSAQSDYDESYRPLCNNIGDTHSMSVNSRVTVPGGATLPVLA